MCASAFSIWVFAFFYWACIYHFLFKPAMKRNSSHCNTQHKECNVFLAHLKDTWSAAIASGPKGKVYLWTAKSEKACQCQSYLLKEQKRAAFFFLFTKGGASKLVVSTMPDSPGSREHNLCQVWPEFLDTCQIAPFLWKLKLNHSRIQNINYSFRSWALPDLLCCRLAQQGTWPLRFWSPGWTWRTWSPSNKQMCTPWLWSSGKWHLAVMLSEVSAISLLLSESMFG